ncbi:MAG: hypothetical protein ABDH61_01655 [Acidilobaceae archaeon]
MSKRLGFPKKREDVERIVEEVSAEHEHEHHHHHEHEHHHHEEPELRMVIDSLSAKLSLVEERLEAQSTEIARLYKVLAHLVEALAADSEEEKKRAIAGALAALE